MPSEPPRGIPTWFSRQRGTLEGFSRAVTPGDLAAVQKAKGKARRQVKWLRVYKPETLRVHPGGWGTEKVEGWI